MSNDYENPYAPPAAAVELEEESVRPDASNGKRFLNFIIDRLGIYGMAYGMGLLAGWLYESGTAKGPAEFFSRIDAVGDILFSALLSLLFYSILEGACGRSLGKLITGTKAVMKDGSRLRFSSAVTRSLCRLIPFEPFSFLGKSGGWHDTMTGTRVIDLRARRIPVRRPNPYRPPPPGAPGRRS